MNISIPDPLYERLDRLRDRVNASKVCTIALQKELDMIEGRSTATVVADAQVERLVQRLQGKRQSWYQRGRQDGEHWAVEVATADELHHIGEEREDDDNYDLDQDDLPYSFDLWDTVAKWPDGDSLEDETDLKEAYLRGWHYAIRDLWQAAKPRLDWGRDD